MSVETSMFDSSGLVHVKGSVHIQTVGLEAKLIKMVKFQTGQAAAKDKHEKTSVRTRKLYGP